MYGVRRVQYTAESAAAAAAAVRSRATRVNQRSVMPAARRAPCRLFMLGSSAASGGRRGRQPVTGVPPQPGAGAAPQRAGWRGMSACTHPVDLDAEVLDEVFVVDALEDLELLGDGADGAVVVGLQVDLLHGHQVARLVVHRRVHAPEPALACRTQRQTLSTTVYIHAPEPALACPTQRTTDLVPGELTIHKYTRNKPALACRTEQNHR